MCVLIVIDTTEFSVLWDNLPGMDEIKAAFDAQFTNSDGLYGAQESQDKNRLGILLYGPPGTGKTDAVKVRGFIIYIRIGGCDCYSRAKWRPLLVYRCKAVRIDEQICRRVGKVCNVHGG